jgi:acetyl esterase/lipase
VPGAQRLAYGDAPSQWIDVAFPTAAPTTAANETNRAAELIVLIHGGFWRDTYGADLMKPLAGDLLERGHPVANLEYRRLGEPGGGWPGTFEDVAAGLDRLDSAGRDLGRALPGTVVTVGHSAGGQLAVWAAGRHRLGRAQSALTRRFAPVPPSRWPACWIFEVRRPKGSAATS